MLLFYITPIIIRCVSIFHFMRIPGVTKDKLFRIVVLILYLS